MPVHAGGGRPAQLWINPYEATETGWTATPHQANTASGLLQGRLLTSRCNDTTTCKTESRGIILTRHCEMLPAMLRFLHENIRKTWVLIRNSLKKVKTMCAWSKDFLPGIQRYCPY